jgi:hypothetical protein
MLRYFVFFIGLFLTFTLLFAPIGIPLMVLSWKWHWIEYKRIKRYDKELLENLR